MIRQQGTRYPQPTSGKTRPNKALTAQLSNHQSTSLTACFNNIRAETQRTLRAMESDWWAKKSSEIQHHVDTINLLSMTPSSLPMAHRGRTKPRSDQQMVPSCTRTNNRSWTNGLSTSTLLNTILDSPPCFAEVPKAIADLKNSKSPGLDGIPAEILMHTGEIPPHPQITPAGYYHLVF